MSVQAAVWSKPFETDVALKFSCSWKKARIDRWKPSALIFLNNEKLFKVDRDDN